jgi:Tfp pilus assembly protein PilN
MPPDQNAIQFWMLLAPSIVTLITAIAALITAIANHWATTAADLRNQQLFGQQAARTEQLEKAMNGHLEKTIVDVKEAAIAKGQLIERSMAVEKVAAAVAIGVAAAKKVDAVEGQKQPTPPHPGS